MTTYPEWRAMWDQSGPWRPTTDDIDTLLTEIDRLTGVSADPPVPEDCGKRDPRIGNSGLMVCELPKGHNGEHASPRNWPSQPGWPNDDEPAVPPTDDYKRARGAIKLDRPAEDLIREARGGESVDPPTSRWTDEDDLRWLIGHLATHGGALSTTTLTLPARLAPVVQAAIDDYDPTRFTLAAVLHAGHPNPADTEPTTEQVFEWLVRNAGWSINDSDDYVADVLDARAALMREGDDSRG